MKTISVECKGLAVAALDDFIELQGELKSLSKDAYESLKKEMINQGFSFPVNIWRDEDGLHILDGHQRTRVLRRMRDEEGYEIPELPYSETFAATKMQAKLKLLAAASQYGKVEEEGLYAFLQGMEMDPADLMTQYRYPDVDMPKFVESYFLDKSLDENDVGGMAVGEQVRPNEIPPSATMSNVRMVQLFYNDDLHKEFMKLSVEAGNNFKTDNLSDTILEVLRAHGKSQDSNPG